MATAVNSKVDFKDLKPGMCVRIVGCAACCDELRRIQELGLTEGASFEVIKAAPFGDPIEIDIRGYRLCLRKNENCALLLEAINSEERFEIA